VTSSSPRVRNRPARIGDALPSAIVWGLESQIGVNIVRELGRAGIPVLGLAHDANAIGIHSRYLVHCELAQPHSDGLIEQIRELGLQRGACAIFAISERNCLFLARNRLALGGVKALVPDEAALAIVFDKRKTLAIASKHGIRAPRSVQPTSVEGIERVAADLSYPCILKWSDANAVMATLARAGIECKKAEYAYSSGELIAALHRYDSINTWPLVQEYCSGQGLGQFFFMHEGRALRRFQHIRVAEWPPEGGFSSVCDAVPLTEHRELQEKSVALLREIGWEGVAMVEYRYDAASGIANLMEINGRYWGSFPLATHCGAGFALYAYFVEGLGRNFEIPAARTDLRCRMVATELKRLARLFFAPYRIPDRQFVRRPLAELGRFLWDFLRPNVRYYLLCSDDWGPLRKDLNNLLFRRHL
jgi:predicted ATP-grasp superfamily ATP-dependent carboligase